MAKDADYYAKISGTWEKQNFSTLADQVSLVFTPGGGTLLSGVTEVDTALSTINSAIGTASGIATLDGSGYLSSGQIPPYLITGLQPAAGSITLAPTQEKDVKQALTGGLAGELSLDLDNNATAGTYIVVGTGGQICGITVADSPTPGNTSTYKIFGEEGEGASGSTSSSTIITVESGDMIIYTGREVDEPAVGDITYYFVVKNNVYGQAKTDAYGVVQLATAGTAVFNNVSSQGDNVITGTALQTIFQSSLTTSGGASGDYGTGTTVARGDHKHDLIYLRLDSGGTVGDNIILAAETDLADSNSESLIFQGWLGTPSGAALSTLYGNKDGRLVLDDVDGAGYVLSVANWDGVIPQVWVSTLTPTTQGKDGDVWIKYTN